MKIIELQKLSVEEIINQQTLPDRLLRLFGVWCYRETLQWISNPDRRSIEAANVAERYANGEATNEELLAAESAAWSAKSAAEWSAVESAEWSAESAAWSAAKLAAWSAKSASWENKKKEINNKQRDKLIQMIIEMNKIDKILYGVEE